jgi:hypothetical protein
VEEIMMILIAGPYRSGTGDDPEKMAANLRQLESASWPLFQAGHIPMIGEWAALPIWRAGKGERVGDPLYERVFHPVAHRLLERCDAVLRLPGASKGADDDVKVARESGKLIYFALREVPGCEDMDEF